MNNETSAREENLVAKFTLVKDLSSFYHVFTGYGKPNSDEYSSRDQVTPCGKIYLNDRVVVEFKCKNVDYARVRTALVDGNFCPICIVKLYESTH